MFSKSIFQLQPSEVYRALETSPQGISAQEIESRQALYGKNLLKTTQPQKLWQKLPHHLSNPFALLLWISGALTFLLGESALGWAIWGSVILNTGFSLWRERSTQQAMLALNSLMPSYARVIRNGVELDILASELVPGDLLVLADGDHIPADSRIIEAYGLRINNAVLTGESTPAHKTADASLRQGVSEIERPNLVFAGTSVVSGTGKAIVFATGSSTQFGRMARLTQTTPELPSLLQREIFRLTKRISLAAMGISALVFIIGLSDIGLGLSQAFLLALGILVAAVPEGLPATITLSLAMAGQRLSEQGVLVKKLETLETLGMVSVLCTDKNGTLTQNQMTVREIWLGQRNLKVTGTGYKPEGTITPSLAGENSERDLQLLLSAAILCNNSRLRPPASDGVQWSYLGDQTEAAMRSAGLKHFGSETALVACFPRIHELPFDARRKRMSTIHRLDFGNKSMLRQILPEIAKVVEAYDEVAFVKGAPREVLQACQQIALNGEVCSLSEDLRKQVLATLDEYAENALRVLALAYRGLPPRHGLYTPEKVEREMIFLGLMAMHDPPREGVVEAIQTLRRAGIRLIMVTGDYGLTAASLARRIGMLETSHPTIVNGAEFEQMEAAQLRVLLEQEDAIFARMAPEHKQRLVAALQEQGEVVALTGDGVNDTPALRKADLGISMGISGTDVARDAADVILVNDEFANVVLAIGEGRAIYENLRKFVTYIFASNVPEIVPFILTALTGLPLALQVHQILAIDLGTDLLPGLALGTEKPEPDVMLHRPRKKKTPLIDAKLLRRAFLWLGPLEALLAYSGFFLVLYGGNYLADIPFLETLTPDLWVNKQLGPEQLRATAITMFLAGVVMSQIGNVFACRAVIRRGRSLGWLSNRFLTFSIAVEFILILGLIYFPWLADVFNLKPLPLIFWLWLSVYVPALYGIEWAHKNLSHKRAKMAAAQAVLK
ncbi:MAG: cation-transporting P-type ATPase [Chloroflexota bacterium]